MWWYIKSKKCLETGVYTAPVWFHLLLLCISSPSRKLTDCCLAGFQTNELVRRVKADMHWKPHRQLWFKCVRWCATCIRNQGGVWCYAGCSGTPCDQWRPQRGGDSDWSDRPVYFLTVETGERAPPPFSHCAARGVSRTPTGARFSQFYSPDAVAWQESASRKTI